MSDEIKQKIMIHLGIGVKDKKAQQVNEYLSRILDKDEEIIALFNANRVIPSISGLVLTSQRLLTIIDGFGIKVVNEIAADDILEISSKNSMGQMKLYITTKLGETIYSCRMSKIDISKVNNFLTKMSGEPKPIAKKLLPKKEYNAKKISKRNHKDVVMGLFSSRKNKKKKKVAIQQILLSLKNASVLNIRSSLRKDRELLLSDVVATIKQHWNTLEYKFEQHIDEDDYGNILFRNGLEQEFVYFSENVILPVLQHRIDNNETSNKDLTLILQDTLKIVGNLTENYFEIKFEDSNQVITDKLLAEIADNSIADDEFLHTLYTQPAIMENYVNQVTYIFMQDPSITLKFSEKLKITQPMLVTPFVALVFVIFSALHNNKKDTSASKKHHSDRVFTGNNPYKYEEFIKNLLRDGGFNAKKTKGSGDYGVDVMASKNGKTFAIQCKLYNRPVGTKAVQEIVSGRIHYRADFAFVVSDNLFTNAANILARGTNVILTHHKNLLHKLEKLAPNEDEEVGQDYIEPDSELDEPTVTQKIEQPTAEKQWTRDDADELITVILPTIHNG